MLKVKFRKDAGDSRTWWQCPKCMLTDVFFFQQPFNCPKCKWILPAFSLLKSTEQARVRLFRAGNDV